MINIGKEIKSEIDRSGQCHHEIYEEMPIASWSRAMKGIENKMALVIDTKYFIHSYFYDEIESKESL